MQLAITNLSPNQLVLPYLEKTISPGATITLNCAQSELSKMVDLQQAAADGLAEFQVILSAIEVASGVLTKDVPVATAAGDGLQSAQGKRIEQQFYEPCDYVATNSVTDLGTVTIAGSPTLADGQLCLAPIAGTYCTILVRSSGAWIVDPAFVVRKNARVNVGSDTWIQTATSGTAVFEEAAPALAGSATAALGIKTGTTTVAVSSATAPTAGQVLTATSSTEGTWNLPLGSVAVYPIDGVSDDTPSINAALATNAGIANVVLCPGPSGQAFQVLSSSGAVNVPSNTKLGCAAGTKINIDLPNLGTWVSTKWLFSNSLVIQTGGSILTAPVFGVTYAVVSLPNQPVVGNGLELSHSEMMQAYDIISVGMAVVGTTDVTAAGLYGGGGTLNGSTLILTVNGNAQTLTLNGGTNTTTKAAFLAAILARWPELSVAIAGGSSSNKLVLCTVGAATPSLTIGSGTANAVLGLIAGAISGKFTVNVDRPIVWNFAVSDVAEETDPTPHDIDIDFVGATITQNEANGNCIIGFARTKRATVRNIKGAQGQIGIFDLGCRNCLLADSDSIATAGVVFQCQTNEYSTLRNITTNARGCVASLQLLDCYVSSMDNCHVSGSTIARQIGVFTSGPGSNGCSINGGSATNTGGDYIQGSKGTQVVGSWTYNSNYGVLIDGSKDTTILGGGADGCVFGIGTINANSNTKISAYLMRNCGTDFSTTGELFCDAITSDGCKTSLGLISSYFTINGWSIKNPAFSGAGPIVNFSGSFASIKNLNLSVATATALLFSGPGGNYSIRDSILGTSGTNVISNNNSGTVYCEDVNFTAGTYAVAKLGTGDIVLGPGCASACTHIYGGGAAPPIIKQDGGLFVHDVAAMGAIVSLSQAQFTQFEAKGLLPSNQNEYFPAVPGLMWNVTNNTTGAHTYTLLAWDPYDGGANEIILAQGKTITARIGSDFLLHIVAGPF